MVGYVAAGQDAIPPNGKSPAYSTDREHQKVLNNLRFGAGTPVGLRPPYVPAPKRSHPVCRATLILIVALHWTCPGLIPALIDDYLLSRRQDYGSETRRRLPA